MSEPIHQEVSFDAEPEKLYETLLSPQRFGEVTGAAVAIDVHEGGSFACFDGQITGRNIELVPGKRIVQAWRVAAWDEGVYSIVRFNLTKTQSGARLTLDHSGFPEGSGEHLAEGWPKMYWEPLRKYLASSDR